MTQISEGLILGCLISGLGITTIIIFNKVSTWNITLSEALLQAVDLYKYQILIAILTLLVVLMASLFFQTKKYKREKLSLNCTKKISVEEYERTKKQQTEEAVKKLIESDAYKKHLEDKKNNRLREVEMTESDRILLSDDSSVDNEDERDGRGQ